MGPSPVEVGHVRSLPGLPRLKSLSHRSSRQPALQQIKLDLIEWAVGEAGAESIADLGGIWAVDGGYTFYALEHFELQRACLVDDHITPRTAERARRHPQLELVEGNFGNAAVRGHVGEVDLLLLFDVLLHQVDPDWDEVLASYAPTTKAFGVVNPQWVASPESVRLIDLGREEYLASVPDLPNHRALFDRLEESHPDQERPWRDVHEVWQWGITDGNLERSMEGLGFEKAYFHNGGPWQDLDRFENHAFVFRREGA